MVDARVLRRYEVSDEDDRLWVPGKGDLVRLRSWDLFDRVLAPGSRVADVGGGPGTHAAHLAEAGHEVVLVDPVPGHLDRARTRTDGLAVEVVAGDARALELPDASFDAVLLMGPLYHLVEPADRATALAEARRVLRPGGRLVAEAITRHAWVLDATLRHQLGEPGIWDQFATNVERGLSHEPTTLRDGGFWAYFHRPDELGDEVAAAGFADVGLRAVEGFAWLLGDLDARMADADQRADLLRALRLVEAEASMLGASAHVVAVATAPGGEPGA